MKVSQKQKTSWKIIRYTAIGLGMVLILLFLFKISSKISNAIKDNQQALSKVTAPGYSMSSEDSSLFKTEYLKFISKVYVFNSKNQNPFTFFTYNDKYRVLLTKIKLETDATVNELIRDSIINKDRSINMSYHPVSLGVSNISIRSGVKKTIKSILVNSSDNFIQKHLSPYLYATSSNSYRLSLQYNNSEIIDIFLEGSHKL